jgi:hypothetical protein
LQDIKSDSNLNNYGNRNQTPNFSAIKKEERPTFSNISNKKYNRKSDFQDYRKELNSLQLNIEKIEKKLCKLL